MNIRFILTVFCCLVFSVVAHGQQSKQDVQSKDQNQGETTRNRTKSRQGSVTTSAKSAVDEPTLEQIAERKRVLMSFVDEHHPDLKRLLGLLEEKKPEQFRKAIKTLSRSYDRLQTVKKRDPEKYEIGLKLWKIHSRIEYVGAQIALNGPEKFEERLTNLLRQHEEVKAQLLRLDIRQQEERLKKMRTNLSESRDNRDATIEKKRTQIINSAKSRKRVNSVDGSANQNSKKNDQSRRQSDKATESDENKKDGQ